MGPKKVREDMAASEQRMRNIARATDWIKNKAGVDDTIAVSYFCFNPDVFYM